MNNSREAQIRLMLVFASIVISLFLFETAINVVGFGLWTKEEVAARSGVIWDTRTKLEVLLASRKSGRNSVPRVSPSMLLKENHLQRRLLPLGGISNAETILCNESGYWVTYRSDEYGFRNPPGLYDTGTLSSAGTVGRPFVLAVGDSFAQGVCVDDGSTILDVVRRRYPMTLNLSNVGNGPLAELAGVREFAVRLKPRYIVWLYYEGNDLADLENEARTALVKYMDIEHTNRLFDIQADVDSYLSEFVSSQLLPRGLAEIEAANSNNYREPDPVALKILKLQMIRRMIHRITDNRSEPIEPTARAARIARFIDVLRVASVDACRAGSTIVFVTLPDYHRVLNGHAEYEAQSAEIEQEISRLGISRVDVANEFRSKDPASFFPFRLQGHYNSEGYRVVGELILARIKGLEESRKNEALRACGG